jgi:hypothetical protein
MPPPLHPLHLDFGAPCLAYGYSTMATTPMNLVGGEGKERLLCVAG